MLSLRIALRYLLSRKSHGAVNIISAVSMAGVAVAAAAMIIVLSVFNGFSQLVKQKTCNFNPPLLVTTANGSILQDADSIADAIGRINGVALASPVIDEQAFAVSEGGQMPVKLRAMTAEAIAASGMGKIIIDGDINPSEAILSVGVAMKLNLRPQALQRQQQEGPVTDIINIFEPRRTGRVNPANPTASFRGDSLRVSAVYQVEQNDQDMDMLIVPLLLARDLLDYTTEATSVAIYLNPNVDPEEMKEVIADRLPAGLTVLNQLEQEADSYRMISIEKWITFLMLLFILAVSSFNIISTISLMVVEKEKNMGVLSAMGANTSMIRAIFANQGWIITLGGGCIGLLIGSLLTLGQQTFGWIKLHSANPAIMTIDHYPVSLNISDLLTVLFSILITSLLIAYIGSKAYSSKRY